MVLGTITETQQQSMCRRTDEWIKKMGYIYTMKCYSAIKKNRNKSFVDKWMGPECDIQGKVRKRKTNILVCGI